MWFYVLISVLTSVGNYDALAINHDNQDKTNDDDKKEIERLTKELNTLS